MLGLPDSLSRMVRVTRRGAGWRPRSMLNPFRSGFFAVQLFSHKVMRYAVPFFLLCIFFSSAALSPHSNFFLLVFSTQVCFFAAALAGWALERRGASPRLFALPQYFVLTNLATVLALYRFLRGNRYAKWEPIREQVAVSTNRVAPDGGDR